MHSSSEASSRSPLRLGLLGIGNVGQSVFDVLTRNQDEISRRAGRSIEVVMASRRNLAAAKPLADAGVRVVADPADIVRDPSVDVVVELIGGTTVARDLVLQAIANGKHVVTANKALLAEHGTEIFDAAHKAGVVVAFEAAVAGGIPIIKALREGLTANRIQWLAGIINGTTNFILSEMRSKGLDFATVLKTAQSLGYAEADPTFDIEGVDAAHKLALMSAIAFGVPVQFDKAHIEGITQLDAQDIRYAEQLGYRIKLLGITKRVPTGIELRVHPCLVPSERLLANVEGAMNAVVVQGDAVGTTLYYGKGAGGEPTASAVIADLVDVARVGNSSALERVPALAFQPDAMVPTPVLPISDVVSAYYLRLRVSDEAGVLANLTGVLAKSGISIDAMLQREAHDVSGQEGNQTDLVMLTHEVREGTLDEALAHIQALPTVLAPVVRLRKEELA
ncbi:MAG: homoserine dehydrogenase [Burkholderiaceae bacterium]|nr:homoserine dehydrogenase [Burkholderiaceae bacterium]